LLGVLTFVECLRDGLGFCWKLKSKSGYSLKTRRTLPALEETVFQPTAVRDSR
jgi:hypothetical protein